MKPFIRFALMCSFLFACFTATNAQQVPPSQTIAVISGGTASVSTTAEVGDIVTGKGGKLIVVGFAGGFPVLSWAGNQPAALVKVVNFDFGKNVAGQTLRIVPTSSLRRGAEGSKVPTFTTTEGCLDKGGKVAYSVAYGGVGYIFPTAFEHQEDFNVYLGSQLVTVMRFSITPNKKQFDVTFEHSSEAQVAVR